MTDKSAVLIVEADIGGGAREALAEGIRGIVILDLVIDTEGKVSGTRIIRSIPGLDEAALVAARQWVYSPVKVNGRPVSVRLTVPITFALKLPEIAREASARPLVSAATARLQQVLAEAQSDGGESESVVRILRPPQGLHVGGSTRRAPRRRTTPRSQGIRWSGRAAGPAPRVWSRPQGDDRVTPRAGPRRRDRDRRPARTCARTPSDQPSSASADTHSLRH